MLGSAKLPACQKRCVSEHSSKSPNCSIIKEICYKNAFSKYLPVFVFFIQMDRRVSDFFWIAFMSKLFLPKTYGGEKSNEALARCFGDVGMGYFLGKRGLA